MISDKTKKTLETMHNCCISINYINETYDGFALGGLLLGLVRNLLLFTPLPKSITMGVLEL